MVTIGIDEVGRGCWAGPLLAAAVALDESRPITGLDDSKKLSKKRREQLDAEIRDKAIAIGIGWVWPSAIDISGITLSVKDAMTQALLTVTAELHPPKTTVTNNGTQLSHDTYIDTGLDIIIDGSYNFLPEFAGSRTVVGADGLIPAVSAASIVAKVARDNYMAEIAAQEYPAYGFEKHVGYGTAVYIAALAKYGVTPQHRMSYKPIQKFLLQSSA